MFAITGATRLHYVSGYTDMRSGRFTLANIIRSNLGGDPYNGDGYVFMSKDRRKMKILVYRNHLYMLYDLSFDKGYRFMRVTSSDGSALPSMTDLEWRYLVALAGCPERKSIGI